MAPILRSKEVMCGKCSEAVKEFVTCAKCGQNYHPSCIVKVCGMFVDDCGKILCCCKSMQMGCDCKMKDEEIARLKQRILEVNVETFNKTLAEFDGGLDDEIDGVCESGVGVDPRCGVDSEVMDRLAEFGWQISNLQKTLTEEIGRIKSLMVASQSKVANSHFEANQSVTQNINKPTLSTSVQQCSSMVNSHKPIASTSMRHEEKEKNAKKSQNPSQKLPNCVDEMRNILIVGDDQCRGATQLMQDYSKAGFHIETVVKPSATFEDVTGGIVQMARGFGKSDFVLIFAGTNDVLREKEFDRKKVTDLIMCLKHTNVCVTSVPLLNTKPKYNVFVNDFNDKMRQIVSDFACDNVVFFDVGSCLRLTDITCDGTLFTVAERRRIIFHLYDQIIMRKILSVDVGNFPLAVPLNRIS